MANLSSSILLLLSFTLWLPDLFSLSLVSHISSPSPSSRPDLDGVPPSPTLFFSRPRHPFLRCSHCKPRATHTAVVHVDQIVHSIAFSSARVCSLPARSSQRRSVQATLQIVTAMNDCDNHHFRHNSADALGCWALMILCRLCSM
ncbi:uncharacterized protein [Zea mays]|uniref:uncharacterized protein isoform X1 n=1 Tax=Zea mays TaxID=4577 RepID=UPI0009A9844D|nr:uncharacterized protein LOC100274722 isoform X1 [Zea mays]|eukprot:XP_020394450.1 uncharacterized protein LOC100274722 isoform X1 [Zea mays]